MPPHIHETHDEYVCILDGELTLVKRDAEHVARPRELVRFPMGQPHGLSNRSGANMICLFWVTPIARL